MILLLALLLSFSAVGLGKDCYSDETNPYLMFGTKTSYEFVYGRPKYGDDRIPNCEPVQVWLLSRHGTRYPGKDTIASMQSLQYLRVQILRNHEERKSGRLCQQDLDNLRDWRLKVTPSDTNLLTEQGKQELQFLGRRMRSKYPSLFQQGYSQNLFEFRHTTEERTKQSAEAFADGLFGPNAGVWIPPAIVNDTIIHAYENCTHWLKMVDDNPETYKERDLFMDGDEVKALMHNVSQRLGFQYDLPKESIMAMYDMCRFDKAWAVSASSPWCAAFTRQELKVLEYYDDLETYYDSGYGNELNVKLGCSSLKDMLRRFQQLEIVPLQDGYQPASVFYFTHSKALIMMLSRLGLFGRGPAPRHDNYHSQYRREWRISQISPFAANFAAVFYKCSVGENNRVMFFLNEKRIDFDGCEVGLCSWKDIKNRFSDVLDSNLDWCRNAGSRAAISSVLVIATYSFIKNFIF